MQKKYRNLWVFGDSYSTPNCCVNPVDSFWVKVANKLKVENIVNYSWGGNSFDSVVHTLISESEQYDWEQDFFLVGIPPLVRLTVAGDPANAFFRSMVDLSGNIVRTEQILCHHGLEIKSFRDVKSEVRFEDPTWTEIQACHRIFLLNHWLDSRNANYFILNLSKDFMFDRPSTGKFLQEYCFGHERNVLRGDTYYGINVNINPPADFDKYGWAGHHGAAGNNYFFQNSLLPRLKKHNFI